MLRVIAGSAKGHKLKTLEGRLTRPTSDRIKESLFNILSGVIEGACFLDLYAGTGSIGIEALSRGAKSATFVDENPQCIKIIRDNLEHTKLTEKANVLKSSVTAALRLIATQGNMFDIIFIDPPYGKGIPDVVVAEIDKLELLKTEGIVIVEKADRDNITQQQGGLFVKDTRSYGDTQLVFFGCLN